MCYIVFISHSLHWRYIKIALGDYVIIQIISTVKIDSLNESQQDFVKTISIIVSFLLCCNILWLYCGITSTALSQDPAFKKTTFRLQSLLNK